MLIIVSIAFFLCVWSLNEMLTNISFIEAITTQENYAQLWQAKTNTRVREIGKERRWIGSARVRRKHLCDCALWSYTTTIASTKMQNIENVFFFHPNNRKLNKNKVKQIIKSTVCTYLDCVQFS